MQHLDSIFRLYHIQSYVCTGEEDEGLQTALVANNTYFFYLANIHAGAVIKYENGRFYTNDPTMTVTMPASEEEKTVPAEETDETMDIPGRGQGGTEQGGDYYGTIPEEAQGQTAETVTTYEADGTPRLFYKSGDTWIEIPLLSAEEVERLTGGILDLKMINTNMQGTIVEVG